MQSQQKNDMNHGKMTLQRILRRETVAVIDPIFLKSLQEKDINNFLIAVLQNWIGISLAFSVAIFFWKTSSLLTALIWLPLAIFIATRINSLNVQVHEGSHGLLAESRTLNDFLCNWLAAYPTLYDVDQYQSIHTQHHKYLSEQKDPELPYYRITPGWKALLIQLGRDFFWLTLFTRLFTIKDALKKKRNTSKKTLLMHIAGRLIWQTLIISILSAFLGIYDALLFYCIFWLLPFFSFYPMVLRIRSVAEHYDINQESESTAQKAVFIARTTSTKAIEHYLLGAQMEYHFEHHLFPNIPYKNLHKLHQHLIEKNFFNTAQHLNVEHSLSDGYIQFWKNHVLKNS